MFSATNARIKHIRAFVAITSHQKSGNEKNNLLDNSVRSF